MQGRLDHLRERCLPRLLAPHDDDPPELLDVLYDSFPTDHAGQPLVCLLFGVGFILEIGEDEYII